MSNLVPILISWVQQYGYPALWGCVFVAAIGIPLPISLVFLAAGAFAALGDFSLLLLAIIGVTASVCGDSLGYLIGKKWGSKLFYWLTQQPRVRFLSPRTLEKSRTYFTKRGGLAIFFSRFLFAGLGGTINLVAGAELYPYPHFLLYDLSGEVLGALIPLLLGYTFGASWEAVGDILSAASLVIIALFCAAYFTWRFIKQLKRVPRPQIEVKQIAKAKKSREDAEEPQNFATFSGSQTYTKEIDGYLEASLDSLPGNYTKNGPGGLE